MSSNENAQADCLDSPGFEYYHPVMSLPKWLRVCLVLLVVASTLSARFVSDSNPLVAVLSENSEESTLTESDTDSNIEIFDALLGEEYETTPTATTRVGSQSPPLPRFVLGHDLSARGPPSA